MYKVIADLNREHGVFLVQDTNDLCIYVKKILDIYNLDVYRFLYTDHIEGTPRIKELISEEDHLTVIEEYISGVSLRDRIDKQELTLDDILSYVNDICSILNSLHSSTKPVIHRDIKPGNIIITSYNKAVLLDFNAAKFYSEESQDTILLGTKGYAAPEQYGFGSSSVQSDIYALGIMFKEMLDSINCEDTRLLNICNKCTQLSPKERYKNVKELSDAIYNYKHPFNTSSLKPVGFRSGKALNMILASTVYVFLAFVCFGARIENVEGAQLIFDRACYFVVFVALIFCTFDYQGIQSSFPLTRHSNPFIRVLGIIIMDASVLLLILVCWMIGESVLFPH
ncbi:MAG: protein kinase [Erysipelotrichaceae bacterium]